MVEYGARRYADEVDVQHDLQSRSNDEVNGKDCTQPNRVNARAPAANVTRVTVTLCHAKYRSALDMKKTQMM